MSSSMGRIIPYIMEKLKMFQTTNQIYMHMPVVTVLIDTLPSRDNMAIDGVQTRLRLWPHYNGALTLIVFGSWSHKKSESFRFPVPLRDFMMYKLTLPMSWCRTLVCFFWHQPIIESCSKLKIWNGSWVPFRQLDYKVVNTRLQSECSIARQPPGMGRQKKAGCFMPFKVAATLVSRIIWPRRFTALHE